MLAESLVAHTLARVSDCPGGTERLYRTYQCKEDELVIKPQAGSLGPATPDTEGDANKGKGERDS